MDILDYKEPVCKIYFTRHGQTKANKDQLLFGQLDWDLNKEGVKQAKQAAVNLLKIAKKVKIDHIISSPLKRTKHTAKIIIKKLVRAGLAPAQVTVDKNLIEKSEGLWEGHSFWEVRKKDPQNYKKWLKDPFRIRPPKGESVEDLNKRARKFYKTVLRKYLGKNIIVVTHSGPIRLFILNLLKTNINKFWYFKVETGSITEVHVSKKQSLVWAINRIW